MGSNTAGTRPPDPGREAPGQPRSTRSDFFAQILVEERILTTEDLRVLVELQQSEPPESRRPIALLAMERGFLDQRRFLALLDEHCHRLHVGELLVLRGVISLADLERAAREQKETGEMLGETLLRLNLVEQSTLAASLAQQANIAFIPIRNIPVDPALRRWMNPSFALKNGIVPISCRARSLTVAIWQPLALPVASDLEHATGLNVSVVLTTRGELEERLQALYFGSEDSGDEAA